MIEWMGAEPSFRAGGFVLACHRHLRTQGTGPGWGAPRQMFRAEHGRGSSSHKAALTHLTRRERMPSVSDRPQEE